MRYISKLSGHSGCTIWLCGANTGKSLFVRKICGDSSYNYRLEQQAIKQSKYSLFFKDNLKETEYDNVIYIPPVLNCGVLDGRFYFDMEFIVGETFGAYILNAEIQDLVKKYSIIFRAIKLISSTGDELISCPKNVDINEVFKCKLNNLIDRIDPIYIPLINDIISKDFSKLTPCACFGDLSLEKILVTNTGKLVFIDLLDSFFDHWVMDYSKLLFDVSSGWSNRTRKLNLNNKLRNLISLEILKDFIAKESKYIQDVSVEFSKIHALRILPYCDDQASKEIILNYLNRYL